MGHKQKTVTSRNQLVTIKIVINHTNLWFNIVHEMKEMSPFRSKSLVPNLYVRERDRDRVTERQRQRERKKDGQRGSVQLSFTEPLP